MNNTDYGYHIHSTIIHEDNIPRKTTARQSYYSVIQKSSPLNVFAIFSLVVNLCN